MTEAQIYAELKRIFAEVFVHSNVTRSTELNTQGVPGWDSLRYVSVLIAMEERFGLEVEPEDLEGVNSVGDLVNAIVERTL